MDRLDVTITKEVNLIMVLISDGKILRGHTRVVRRARAVAAFPIHLLIFGEERLSVMVEPRYVS